MKKLSLLVAVLMVGASLFAQDGAKKENAVKKEVGKVKEEVKKEVGKVKETVKKEEKKIEDRKEKK